MFKRVIALFVTVSFILSYYQPVYAQDFSINQLPVPGTMVGESVPFTPLALKGLVINIKKPLEFQFIVDTGHGQQDIASVKDQANQLVKYFLAGLTIPKGDLWVNLSPYEKNRMVPETLGQTDLGRDLLAQDYILKQLTASLIYPEKDLGKEFWSRVYAKAQQQFGTTNVPVNTFNKVWILPDQAQVFEHGAAAYVTKATLKVMLDEDYLALQKHATIRNGMDLIGANIVRQIVIPEITKEVNTGKNFAPLRQIYQALILAKWYKETIQNSLLDAVYTNKNKVDGVNLDDPAVKEQIYERYLKAYKKGAFNYIKEDPMPDGQVVPRKYFSGGITHFGDFAMSHDGKPMDVHSDGAMAVLTEYLQVSGLPQDAAMNNSNPEEKKTKIFEMSRRRFLRYIGTLTGASAVDPTLLFKAERGVLNGAEKTQILVKYINFKRLRFLGRWIRGLDFARNEMKYAPSALLDTDSLGQFIKSMHINDNSSGFLKDLFGIAGEYFVEDSQFQLMPNEEELGYYADYLQSWVERIHSNLAPEQARSLLSDTWLSQYISSNPPDEYRRFAALLPEMSPDEQKLRMTEVQLRSSISLLKSYAEEFYHSQRGDVVQYVSSIRHYPSFIEEIAAKFPNSYFDVGLRRLRDEGPAFLENGRWLQVREKMSELRQLAVVSPRDSMPPELRKATIDWKKALNGEIPLPGEEELRGVSLAMDNFTSNPKFNESLKKYRENQDRMYREKQDQLALSQWKEEGGRVRPDEATDAAMNANFEWPELAYHLAILDKEGPEQIDVVDVIVNGVRRFSKDRQKVVEIFREKYKNSSNEEFKAKLIQGMLELGGLEGATRELVLEALKSPTTPPSTIAVILDGLHMVVHFEDRVATKMFWADRVKEFILERDLNEVLAGKIIDYFEPWQPDTLTPKEKSLIRHMFSDDNLIRRVSAQMNNFDVDGERQKLVYRLNTLLSEAGLTTRIELEGVHVDSNPNDRVLSAAKASQLAIGLKHRLLTPDQLFQSYFGNTSVGTIAAISLEGMQGQFLDELSTRLVLIIKQYHFTNVAVPFFESEKNNFEKFLAEKQDSPPGRKDLIGTPWPKPGSMPWEKPGADSKKDDFNKMRMLLLALKEAGINFVFYKDSTLSGEIGAEEECKPIVQLVKKGARIMILGNVQKISKNHVKNVIGDFFSIMPTLRHEFGDKVTSIFMASDSSYSHSPHINAIRENSFHNQSLAFNVKGSVIENEKSDVDGIISPWDDTADAIVVWKKNDGDRSRERKNFDDGPQGKRMPNQIDETRQLIGAADRAQLSNWDSTDVHKATKVIRERIEKIAFTSTRKDMVKQEFYKLYTSIYSAYRKAIGKEITDRLRMRMNQPSKFKYVKGAWLDLFRGRFLMVIYKLSNFLELSKFSPKLAFMMDGYPWKSDQLVELMLDLHEISVDTTGELSILHNINPHWFVQVVSNSGAEWVSRRASDQQRFEPFFYFPDIEELVAKLGKAAAPILYDHARELITKGKQRGNQLTVGEDDTLGLIFHLLWLTEQGTSNVEQIKQMLVDLENMRVIPLPTHFEKIVAPYTDVVLPENLTTMVRKEQQDRRLMQYVRQAQHTQEDQSYSIHELRLLQQRQANLSTIKVVTTGRDSIKKLDGLKIDNYELKVKDIDGQNSIILIQSPQEVLSQQEWSILIKSEATFEGSLLGTNPKYGEKYGDGQTVGFLCLRFGNLDPMRKFDFVVLPAFEVLPMIRGTRIFSRSLQALADALPTGTLLKVEDIAHPKVQENIEERAKPYFSTGQGEIFRNAGWVESELIERAIPEKNASYTDQIWLPGPSVYLQKLNPAMLNVQAVPSDDSENQPKGPKQFFRRTFIDIINGFLGAAVVDPKIVLKDMVTESGPKSVVKGFSQFPAIADDSSLHRMHKEWVALGRVAQYPNDAGIIDADLNFGREAYLLEEELDGLFNDLPESQTWEDLRGALHKLRTEADYKPGMTLQELKQRQEQYLQAIKKVMPKLRSAVEDFHLEIQNKRNDQRMMQIEKRLWAHEQPDIRWTPELRQEYDNWVKKRQSTDGAMTAPAKDFLVAIKNFYKDKQVKDNDDKPVVVEFNFVNADGSKEVIISKSPTEITLEIKINRRRFDSNPAYILEILRKEFEYLRVSLIFLPSAEEISIRPTIPEKTTPTQGFVQKREGVSDRKAPKNQEGLIITDENRVTELGELKNRVITKNIVPTPGGWKLTSLIYQHGCTLALQKGLVTQAEVGMGVFAQTSATKIFILITETKILERLAEALDGDFKNQELAEYLAGVLVEVKRANAYRLKKVVLKTLSKDKLRAEIKALNHVLGSFWGTLTDRQKRLLDNEKATIDSENGRADSENNSFELIKILTAMEGFEERINSFTRKKVTSLGVSVKLDTNYGARGGRQGYFNKERDQAMIVNPSFPGGIDLNKINVKRTGKTINVQFDPAQLNELEQSNFKGFTPVITGFRYIQSPFPLLGLNDPSKEPEALVKI